MSTRFGQGGRGAALYPVGTHLHRAIYSRDEAPRTFLLMAGAGLDAHIVYSLNVALKGRLGKVAYWLAGFNNSAAR